MAELASQLGVSESTVSKALAGDPKVAAATRERVRAAAELAGYQANPTAALLAKRRRQGPAACRLSVAFLATVPEAAFSAVCAAAGVTGEFVELRASDSPKRLLEVLWNRGVSGLILSPELLPWKGGKLAELPWSRFSVVKLARVRSELAFHLVRHSAFDYTLLTLHHACAGMNQRVCLVLWRSESEADNLGRLGALLAFREEMLPAGVEIEWRYWEGPLQQPDPAAREWLLARRPDVVVFYHSEILATLERMSLPAGFRPRFHAILHSADYSWLQNPLSGCEMATKYRLQRALDLLLELIGRGERGFASLPAEYVIEPVWVPASSRGSSSRSSGTSVLGRNIPRSGGR